MFLIYAYKFVFIICIAKGIRVTSTYKMLTSVIVLIFACVVHCVCGTIYNCDRTSPCGCSFVDATADDVIDSTRTSSFRSKMVNNAHHYYAQTSSFGGKVVRKNSWGWAISLRWRNRHMCTGIIVHERYIITAAHCTVDEMTNLHELTVCAGSDRLSDVCRQSRSVDRIINHPQYNAQSLANDIAIIHLAEPLDLTDKFVSKICLPNVPEGSLYPPPGTAVIGVGWGRTTKNGVSSNDLRQISVTVMNGAASVCANLQHNDRIHICAYAEGKGKISCQ